MFSCGVHFGHKASFKNPKMLPYVIAERSGLQIINLEKTKKMFEDSLVFVDQLVRSGGRVVVVGTKQVAQEVVAKYGTEMKMPYVDQRWLGGMLTNFKTVRGRVSRLEYLNKKFEENDLNGLTKKERLILRRERAKLAVSLGGVQDLNTLPEALFVIDVIQERIAIQEANKLGIPVIGVVDTNCSPEGLDYVIPGNDDSLSAIEYYLSCLSSVVSTARSHYEAEQAKVEKSSMPKIRKKTVATESATSEEVKEGGDQSDESKEAGQTKKRVVKKRAEKSQEDTSSEQESPKKTVKAAPAKKAAAEKKTVAKKVVKKPTKAASKSSKKSESGE